MRGDRYDDAGGYLERGDAAPLFPLADLDAAVYQRRRAQVRLDAAEPADVLVVAPTDWATSLALSQRPLTAIDIDSLAAAIRDSLSTRSGSDVADFEFLQVGRATAGIENRSLTEFQ